MQEKVSLWEKIQRIEEMIDFHYNEKTKRNECFDVSLVKYKNNNDLEDYKEVKDTVFAVSKTLRFDISQQSYHREAVTVFL